MMSPWNMTKANPNRITKSNNVATRFSSRLAKIIQCETLSVEPERERDMMESFWELEMCGFFFLSFAVLRIDT